MMAQKINLEEYDLEPVRYCAKCCSLKIKYEESVDLEYCDECGCSDILEAPIEEWEKKYERKYGHPFIREKKNVRNSPIYKMSSSQLMDKVSNSTDWKEIIKFMYPKFPRGFGKADSIVLFFDKLVKDNRLDDLKGLLYKLKI
jgi:hypothetical protein